LADVGGGASFDIAGTGDPKDCRARGLLALVIRPGISTCRRFFLKNKLTGLAQKSGQDELQNQQRCKANRSFVSV
jgi:hypothetical protein